MAFIVIFFLLPGLRSEEVATPASLLRPRNYNHHAHEAAQYLQQLGYTEPTKQGPVVFPNDAPPPPRTPLIVTSRPLIESIARSELNNSIAEGSQINRVSFRPGFLARVKDYRPFGLVLPTPASYDNQVPYADILKKARDFGGRDNRYDDYEEQTILPPIYKALADHAQHKVLKNIKQKQPYYDYQIKQPNYSLQQRTENDIEEDQNNNYAFSYTVKDHKTGDDFSHSQHSSGSATNGEYRVRLPDGRMQIVSYTADENGYKADVRYDDEDTTSGNSIDNYNDHNKQNNNFNNNDFNINRKNYNINNNYIKNDDYKIDDNQKYKTPTNDYYQYNDVSKEYYNDDFSTEYESKNYDYEPHKSKFTAFATEKPLANYKKYVSASTVKPSYEELKNLLVDTKVYSTGSPNVYNGVELSVPSTTPIPNYERTTEHVVVIGSTKPTLYTNIKNSLPVNVGPLPVFSTSDYAVSSTPRSYLVSTIANLRNKINTVTTKPILSNSFLNRINKYLSFN